MNNNNKRSVLDELANGRFLVVAPDSESYQTAFCRGSDLLRTLAGMLYISPDKMPDDEMAKLKEHVDEPNNWFEAESGPATLDWDIGDESGLVIQVFRLTTTRNEEDAGKKLVALARAAWRMADGTEGTEHKDEFGKHLRVPCDLFKDLTDGLDALDELPELPAPYIGEGPAKAEHALGLRDHPSTRKREPHTKSTST